MLLPGSDFWYMALARRQPPLKWSIMEHANDLRWEHRYGAWYIDVFKHDFDFKFDFVNSVKYDVINGIVEYCI